MNDAGRLFCFGLGFSASVLAARLQAQGWTAAGTTRRSGPDPSDSIPRFRFSRECPLAPEGQVALASATHVLVSIPPDADLDPVLDVCGPLLGASDRLRWIGYLSTTGVYGNTGGNPVDESAPLVPTSTRAERRVAVERRWLEYGRDHDVAVQIFRLAGIYGPGRSVFDRLRAGPVQRIDRPGHRFSRIHVDDIATVLEASMARPRACGIYNVADDEPAEPEKVLAFAAGLIGIEPGPLVPFSEAAASMSPMALSFWQDNRIVVNRRIRDELGVRLAYPSFREGLRAILGREGPGIG